MASCPKCDQLVEGVSLDEPREYLELARRLLNQVKNGELLMTEGTCPLQDLFNPEWPDNLVEHNFQCTSCGRTFQLFADTFHGHAGWGLTGPQTREPDLAPSATA